MIDTVYQHFQQQLASNDFLSGGFALMVLGSAVALLRGVPGQLWNFARRQFTCEAEVRDRELLAWVGEWVARNSYGRRCRRIRALLVPSTELGEGRNWAEIALGPGTGRHFLRFEGRWLLVQRAINKEESLSDHGNFLGALESITITALGRDNAVLDRFFAAVRQQKIDRSVRQRVAVATSWGEWSVSERAEPRPVESVILPPGMRESIVEDVERFLSSASEYRRRGVPYRRGYLFHGPPGNGKSSMISALCGHFGLPLYMIHLREKDLTDARLTKALASIPPRVALLLEDIDCVAPDRDSSSTEGVTLSGLLNAIDGPVATEDRVLFVTSNHPEKLDPALTRPGRIDRTVEFGTPTEEQMVEFFQSYFPERSAEAAEFVANLNGSGGSMASIQEELLRLEGVVAAQPGNAGEGAQTS